MSLQKRWTIFLSYGFVVHKPLFLVQVFCVCVCVGGILKVILFVTILCLFYVLIFWPPGLWNLSSLTKDKTSTPLLWKAKSQPLDH